MNNPQKNLVSEIKWIRKNFDFLDLTLEMPHAHPDKIRVKNIRSFIGDFSVVGHTAWYLPIGSPFKELRVYSIVELEKCISVFSHLGVEKMSVHFDSSLLIIKEKHTINFNIWTLQKLVKLGKKYNIKIMAENTPGLFSQPNVLEYVFKKVPKLLLHLDIGHANIGFKNNQTPFIVKKFAKRLVHIHVSDNSSIGDEHLPIGKGNINWPAMLRAIKSHGYDGTITLEVFTSDKARLEDKPKLRKLWDRL